MKKKGDYVLGLKGNQGQLKKAIEAWFHKANRDGLEQYHQDDHEQITKGHGRIEVRRCQQIELDINWLTHGKEWKGLTTALKVERETQHNGKQSKEVSYYISSLSLNAKQALKVTRSHWEVESMHWVLDMTFKEDASRIRRGNAPEIFNVLRKLALNIVKKDTEKQTSMKRKLKLAALNDEYRTALIINSVKTL